MIIAMCSPSMGSGVLEYILSTVHLTKFKMFNSVECNFVTGVLLLCYVQPLANAAMDQFSQNIITCKCGFY